MMKIIIKNNNYHQYYYMMLDASSCFRKIESVDQRDI